MDINKSPDFEGAEKPHGFLVTGIGASAGGIQALKEFFQHVPADSGIAYVVILHLSPDHDSELAHVLQVVSAIPVLQVIENTKIEPNHVYVVPPNQHLIIHEGFIAPSINLHMEERRAPVDIFFRNLADTHGPRAVCVVLSGTGANGSMGLKRVKEMGGVAYVQNPGEAEFNEMPRNSIATDLVDQVLPVAQIPAKIIAYRNSLGTVEIIADTKKQPESQQQVLREIFNLIRVHTGHDFSNYKQATLLRRIERRINIYNLPDLASYATFLHQNPNEPAALLKDLLISVTNFFRDSKSFETLEQEVLPAIIKNKNSESEVRIWIAGCATGEEAYSIAMLCAEQNLGMASAAKVQIFATDIDDTAIATAREGYYTLNDAADVSPERLRRFFTKDGDGYRVGREIREMILFANHNFLKDPAFSRLDLVTCRNVLIYLNATAKDRVLKTFHFALHPSSFLFLGSSESVDGASDLYATFNREHHIFQARAVSGRNYPVPESVGVFQFTKNDQLQKTGEKETRSRTRISNGELHQKLLEEYAAPSVIVNEEYDIVHMSEKVGKYFEMSGGEPTQNLLKLIRADLRLELRSALYQAVQRKTPVKARNVKIGINGQAKLIDIHVRPVTQDGDGAKGFILVIFQENETNQQAEAMIVSSDEPVAKHLEEELIDVKKQLQSYIEQHEFQAEELKASNEELQAKNEELRSAAEELETSKEELQSINEELRTVNQELKVKIEETSVAGNHLQNLINSANVGTVFLDRNFCTRMYTGAVLEIFNLIPSDYGRPISDITHRLQYNGLLHDAETVLEKLTVVEREVSTTDHRSFMMRVLPYRTSEDRINGVVITFFDISKRKEAEQALQQSEQHLRLLIESAKDYAIFTLDQHRKVVSWSIGAEIIFGFTEAEMMGKTGDIIFVPEDRQVEIPHKEAGTAEKEGRAENERWHIRKDGSRFWASGSTSPLHDKEGRLVGFVKIMRDLTEKKQIEEAKSFLAAIVETSQDSVITIDFQRNITSWNKAAEVLYGYTAEEAVGKNLTMLTLPEDFFEILNKVDAIIHSREVAVFDTVRHNKEGDPKHLEIVMSPVLNTAGEVIGISTIARDVSERKRREANLAFLAQINLDFAPLLSVHDVMEPVGKELARHLRLSRCHFTLIEEQDDRAEVLYEYRHDEKVPAFKGEHRISDILTEEGRRHYSAGKLVMMDAVANRTLVKPPTLMLNQVGFGSLINVPHLEGGRWRFLLTAGRAEAGAWRSDEVELLQELAAKIYIRVQRARAEEALQMSERRLQRMVNISKVGVLTFDEAEHILHANDAFLQMVGYSREEFEGQQFTWRDFTPPEHMDASLQIWTQLQETGRGGPYEKEYYRKDRSKIWLMFVAANLGDGTLAEYAIDISDRKKAEDALHKSEERLANELADTRQLQHISSQIIQEDNIEKLYDQIVDAAIAITHSSAASLQLYVPEKEGLMLLAYKGFAPESASFWQWVNLQSKSTCSAALAKKERFIVTDVDTNEQTAGTADSHAFRLSGIRSFQSTPLISRKGTVVGMISTHWSEIHHPSEREIGLLDVLARQAADLIERKHAEEALRRSETRFRILANVVPQMIWTNTGPGIADYFNQRWYEYTGLSFEQSVGLGWQAVVHQDDARASVDKWKKALTTGKVFDTEYRLRGHDGRYRWFIGRNVPLKDEEGKITGWFGSATDVENLKKAEEALSQSEARLRITMESATDYAIITMDTERRVERWSQGATLLLGYTEAEMTGQRADIIFTEEDRNAGVPQIEMETARDAGRAADDRWHRRKDGSRFYVNGVMRPIEHSELTGYVKIMRDMTQQQLFTEELHRLVEERTRELKRSNEDLQQFAHVASHDLKEPVRKVKTFSGRLNDEFGDLLPERAKTYLKKIDASTNRMFSMIQGVLAYSLVGKTDNSIAPIDLNETIDEIETVLEVLINQKKATITKTKLHTIKGNPTLIFQLFYNLILNALKFSKEDDLPEINLSSEFVQQEDAAFAKITLTDNGIGFDAEFQEVIFQTFSRLNPMDEYEGTGLGLALCKKIVERHGGQISATGELGKGAVFTLFLPVG